MLAVLEPRRASEGEGVLEARRGSVRLGFMVGVLETRRCSAEGSIALAEHKHKHECP